MSYAGVDWHTLLLAAAAVLLAAGGFIRWRRRRPRDPEELERHRRSYLNQVGRIVEGQVLEIIDAPPPEPHTMPRRGLFRKRNPPTAQRQESGARKLVYYTYSISGVTYETAQDLTGLEERACLDRVVTGQVASVKYDPANPSNSILIADDWSGLH